ncbi:MAG: holo-ACP synthase [Flavihumibacter sp.]
MIIGTGIDMVEVARMAVKLGKDNGFKELVFAPEEISYCEKQAHAAQHFAARFAAKEALFKALGTGWKNGTAFNEVVVTHNGEGQPQIHFTGETAHALVPYHIGRIHVSLSHQPSMATAIVILEQ